MIEQCLLLGVIHTLPHLTVKYPCRWSLPSCAQQAVCLFGCRCAWSHPRARVAGLREGVVGSSGGTVPRLLAVFSWRCLSHSLGWSFETLLTL